MSWATHAAGRKHDELMSGRHVVREAGDPRRLCAVHELLGSPHGDGRRGHAEGSIGHRGPRGRGMVRHPRLVLVVVVAAATSGRAA